MSTLPNTVVITDSTASPYVFTGEAFSKQKTKTRKLKGVIDELFFKIIGDYWNRHFIL